MLIQQLHEVVMDPGPFSASVQPSIVLVSLSRREMDARVLAITTIFQGWGEGGGGERRPKYRKGKQTSQVSQHHLRYPGVP